MEEILLPKLSGKSHSFRLRDNSYLYPKNSQKYCLCLCNVKANTDNIVYQGK